MVVARGVPGAVNIYLDDDAGIGAQTKQVECYVGASRSCIKKTLTHGLFIHYMQLLRVMGFLLGCGSERGRTDASAVGSQLTAAEPPPASKHKIRGLCRH